MNNISSYTLSTNRGLAVLSHPSMHNRAVYEGGFGMIIIQRLSDVACRQLGFPTFSSFGNVIDLG